MEYVESKVNTRPLDAQTDNTATTALETSVAQVHLNLELSPEPNRNCKQRVCVRRWLYTDGQVLVLQPV